jgi:hypothetical protein
MTLNARYKGYSSFALLQSSVIVKPKAMKKEDILSQIHLDLDCLEELGIRFNTNNLPIKLDIQHVASDLYDLKHAS